MKYKHIIFLVGFFNFLTVFCSNTEAQQTGNMNRIVPCFHFSVQAPFAFGFKFFQKKLGVFSSVPNDKVDEMDIWVKTDKDLSVSSLAGNYSPRSNLFILINMIVDEKLISHSLTAIEHSFDLIYSQINRHYDTRDKFGSNLNRNFDVKMNKLVLMYRFAISSRKYKNFRPSLFVSGGLALIDFNMIYKAPYPSSFSKNELLVKPRIDVGVTLPLCIEW